MKTQICALLAAFTLLLPTHSSAMEADEETAVPDYIINCVRKKKPPMLKRLDSAEQPPLALFKEQRCPGGVFIQNTNKYRLDADAPFTALGMGWWMEELVGITQQTEPTPLFKVRASYITGIGPTGTRPFNVIINIEKTADGWQVSEPIHVDREFDKPSRLDNGITLVESPEQLEILGVDPRHKDYKTFQAIDFTTHRLAIKPVTLTSGSMRISDIFAYRKKQTYYLAHHITAPTIGTTDIKYTSLWYLLPKNDLAVEKAPRKPGAYNPLEDIKTGEMGRIR